MHLLEEVQILSPWLAYSIFLPFFLELTKNGSHFKREILNSSTKAKAHTHTQKRYYFPHVLILEKKTKHIFYKVHIWRNEVPTVNKSGQ